MAGVPALECRDVHFRVSGLEILKGIDVAVAPGEICGIVGPNGAGKSTLLNVISGFVKPNLGRVLLEGEDVTGMPAWRRARAGVGRTFQLVRLVEELTALENAASGLLMRAPRSEGEEEPAQRGSEAVRASLERVRVAEFGGWPAKSLSFGSRRKVELARAIVSRPRLLLVDELTSGVSQAHIREFGGILRQEAERGCAVVIIDHNLDFIREVAPRVVVLDAGVTVFDGTPAAAFSEPHVIEAYVGKVEHD